VTQVAGVSANDGTHVNQNNIGILASLAAGRNVHNGSRRRAGDEGSVHIPNLQCGVAEVRKLNNAASGPTCKYLRVGDDDAALRGVNEGHNVAVHNSAERNDGDAAAHNTCLEKCSTCAAAAHIGDRHHRIGKLPLHAQTRNGVTKVEYAQSDRGIADVEEKIHHTRKERGGILDSNGHILEVSRHHTHTTDDT
jgi:hypothetical protein